MFNSLIPLLIYYSNFVLFLLRRHTYIVIVIDPYHFSYRCITNRTLGPSEINLTAAIITTINVSTRDEDTVAGFLVAYNTLTNGSIYTTIVCYFL